MKSYIILPALLALCLLIPGRTFPIGPPRPFTIQDLPSPVGRIACDFTAAIRQDQRIALYFQCTNCQSDGKTRLCMALSNENPRRPFDNLTFTYQGPVLMDQDVKSAFVS